MQVEDCQARPKSLWKHLFQQVQEQSEFCDVTVEVHQWSRRYHWCVLSSSPFFAKLYESKLQEQRTGRIKLNVGHSNDVETAIHFLYGQRPKINTETIEDLLEVSEFLMIQELKALCVQKLESVKVDIHNCFKLLFLTSRYNFYLENVSKHFFSHLHELMQMEEMLLLDKDSVRFIITEPMLSYVSREDCFRFLINWIRHHPCRKSDFAELFSCLDVKEINLDVLNSVSLDCVDESDRFLCNSLSQGSNTLCDTLVVYPPDKTLGRNFFYAYKTMQRSWCQIPLKDLSYWSIDVRVAVQNQNTVVRLKNGSQKLWFYNIETKTDSTKNVTTPDTMDTYERINFDYLTVNRCNFFCVRNFSIHKANRDKRHDSLALPYFLRTQNLYDLDDFVLRSVECIKPVLVNVCCLYKSEHEDDSEVRFKPLLSVNGSVKSICVSSGAVCLLVPQNKECIIYALNESVLAKVNLSALDLDDLSYIYPFVHGGVLVVTKTNILQINILVNAGGISATIADCWLRKLEDTGDWVGRHRLPRYEVTEDKLITITYDENYKQVFQYQMLPTNIGNLDKEEKFDIEVPEQLRKGIVHFLQVKLPRDSLRCSINCPHCKDEKQNEIRLESYKREYDSDENIYYDDSSDDCYEPSLYIGSDNFYYGSSDDSYIF